MKVNERGPRHARNRLFPWEMAAPSTFVSRTPGGEAQTRPRVSLIESEIHVIPQNGLPAPRFVAGRRGFDGLGGHPGPSLGRPACATPPTPGRPAPPQPGGDP